MAAQSISSIPALVWKSSRVNASESDNAFGVSVHVGSPGVVRGLSGGVVKRGERVERIEFGRGRVLRRGGQVSCSAGPLTLQKGRKSLPEGYMEEMQEFLRKDLVHLFDEQGIDKTMYDEKVEFRDPITNYDTLDGYLFNIGMLRALFHPIFELHSVKQVRYSFSLSGSLELSKPFCSKL